MGDSKLIARTKRGIELIWYSRSRLGFLNVPIPWRLPYGGWFLAFGDSMGARVCGIDSQNTRTRKGHGTLFGGSCSQE